MSKISLIIEREYLTRVQKKSFILMTILSPIVMVALIFAPIWLAQLSSDEVRQIAIIDQTGLYKNNTKHMSSWVRLILPSMFWISCMAPIFPVS